MTKRIINSYLQLLLDNKRWVSAATLIYVFGTIGGLLIGVFKPEMLESLIRWLIESFQERGVYGEQINTLAIFWLNVRSLFLSLAFGFIFGLSVVFMLLVNGFALGILTYFIVLREPILAISALPLSILPHGVLEFPAIIIAAAFGLKFSVSYLSPKLKGGRWEKIKSSFVELVSIIPLVLLLLFTAAVIESSVTPFLLCKIGKICL